MFTPKTFMVGLIAVQVVSGVSVKNLHARQSDTSDTLPIIPSIGNGSCHDACASYQSQSQVCNSGATAPQFKDDPASCMCNTDFMNNFVTCYDCILPLVQQAGTDPNFQTNIQKLLSDLETSCQEELHPVPSLTITPNYSAAGVTLTAPPTAPPTAHSTGPSGAPSPTGGNNTTNAATANGAMSFGVFAGFVGTALLVLAA